MWKKVLMIQICVSIFLTMGYFVVDKMNIELLDYKKSQVVAAMSKHYTVSDIMEHSKTLVSSLVKAPASVTNYIISTPESTNVGKPIDEVENGEITPVYNVSGGQVVETGENQYIGKYIKIRHDKKMSIYGNCNKIYVSEGEHVRKGHVIGSFKKEKNNEFYYELIEE